MAKFLLGFAVGLGVGAAVALFLSPDSGAGNRERLRLKSSEFAAGEDTPLGMVSGKVGEQRNRLESAIEAGRRASAGRQAEMWASLNLAPPDASAPPATGGAVRVYEKKD